MVIRTWEQAKKASSLDRVVIATDDERIAAVCRKAGAEVIMTSEACPNGMTRDFHLGLHRKTMYLEIGIS